MNFLSTRLPTFSGSDILQSLFIAYSCGAVADFHRASRTSHQQVSVNFPNFRYCKIRPENNQSPFFCNVATTDSGLNVNGELLEPLAVLSNKFRNSENGVPHRSQKS
jgi:hypothetical protein